MCIDLAPWKKTAFGASFFLLFPLALQKLGGKCLCSFPFLAVQDATFYSGDKIDKKDLSTGR